MWHLYLEESMEKHYSLLLLFSQLGRRQKTVRLLLFYYSKVTKMPSLHVCSFYLCVRMSSSLSSLSEMSRGSSWPRYNTSTPKVKDTDIHLLDSYISLSVRKVYAHDLLMEPRSFTSASLSKAAGYGRLNQVRAEREAGRKEEEKRTFPSRCTSANSRDVRPACSDPSYQVPQRGGYTYRDLRHSAQPKYSQPLTRKRTKIKNISDLCYWIIHEFRVVGNEKNFEINKFL